MSYFLLKLAFDTAVHFGASDTAAGADTSSLTLRADTIFSALCHTALATGGSSRLSVLCSMVQQGELQLTVSAQTPDNSCVQCIALHYRAQNA